MLDFATAITNETTTLNGAVTNKSSLNKCLDLFSMGVSSSSKETLITEALNEDFILATKVIFYLRDVRNGQGNKDIARAYHKIMRDNIGEKAFRKKYLQTLAYLPEIGSWKDIYEMYGNHPKVDKRIRKLVHHALFILKDGLAAKWFPRQSQIHKDLAKDMDMGLGELRRTVVSMTNVVETQMCNNQWHEIDYKSIPSVANKKYAKAFLARDNSRREQFLTKVIKGETTIKASVLYPHDLPDYMTEAEGKNVLPIIDTSGSMWCQAGGYGNKTTVKAIDVAVGLGIYFSEHNKGAYKDLWCNFSTNPTFMKLKGSTLSEKVSNLDYSNWSQSTNLQAVFDKILQFGNLADAPKVLLIVSDMEFNACRPNTTNFAEAKRKFEAAGIEMPLVVFWRVNVASQQQPVTVHDSGSVVINGYSPSFVKELLKLDTDQLKSMTPLNMMKKTVQDKYPFVEEIFNNKED
jgi:hypothetical protein